MQKLTLSVDGAVVSSAKRYARARKTSLSRLVEGLLRMVATAPAPRDGARQTPDAPQAPPVLMRLRGSLKRGAVEDYRRHLERKYR